MFGVCGCSRMIVVISLAQCLARGAVGKVNPGRVGARSAIAIRLSAKHKGQ